MKRSRYVNTPTLRQSVQESKKLYERLFGKPFPKKWKIYYDTHGLCDSKSKEIYLSAFSFHDGLPVLIHEFIHMEHPDWEHDSEFMLLEQTLMSQVYANIR